MIARGLYNVTYVLLNVLPGLCFTIEKTTKETGFNLHNVLLLVNLFCLV